MLLPQCWNKTYTLDHYYYWLLINWPLPPFHLAKPGPVQNKLSIPAAVFLVLWFSCSILYFYIFFLLSFLYLLHSLSTLCFSLTCCVHCPQPLCDSVWPFRGARATTIHISQHSSPIRFWGWKFVLFYAWQAMGAVRWNHAWELRTLRDRATRNHREEPRGVISSRQQNKWSKPSVKYLTF